MEDPRSSPAADTMNWKVSPTEIKGKKTQDASGKHVSWKLENSEMGDLGGNPDPHPNDAVACPGSPDIPQNSSLDVVACTISPDNSSEETPDFITKSNRRKDFLASVELSLENGIGLDIEQDSSSVRRDLSPEVQTSNHAGYMEAYFELPTERTRKTPETSLPVVSINAGGTKSIFASSGVEFQEDCFYTGGEVVATDVKIGDNADDELYKTARYGNFFYHFKALEPGDYLVDLHLAEIIFTEGPQGMRVFDVFIQGEKVLSGIDIYAQVGSNRPLIFSNLEAFVDGKDGLLIKFQGVNGSPTVSGISIRKNPSKGSVFQSLVAGNIAPVPEHVLVTSETADKKQSEVFQELCIDCNCKVKRQISLLYKEQLEMKRALEEAKRDNELKSKECTEAWASLHDLQNELMRKSMHVGSLAFAVEGQVKEKSKWVSSLRELSKRFQALKSEHSKLSEEALDCKKNLLDLSDISTTVQSTLSRHVDLEKQHEDLKLKYLEGAKERKELYNKVLELKGNIRVFCRCRPLNSEELAEEASMAIDFESAKDSELAIKCNGGTKKVFKFDAVFSPQADQANVFEDTAPFVTSVLDGYNVCIFAYGQTGTGKTFTMEGTEAARGVNYRTLEELFRIIEERKEVFKYELTVSVLEVYNEQIRDLLSTASNPGLSAKRLEVKQVAEGVHHVPGLVEANVSNMNEVWDVLQTGSNARAVGSTNANEHSSRSHCIHCVMVKGQSLVNGESTRSKLWLVDLAGSERIAKTEAQGDRLKEAQNINRSLSALGDVISSLSNKSQHIPFRNSKLTHLLQDSLGGDSKTLMFVQISPNENDLSETLCSLNFASRVRGIELGAARKQIDISEFTRYKQMFDKAKQDTKTKDEQIKRLEDTINSLELKVKARDVNSRNLQDKVKELESQLLIERRLARQHVDTKIAQQQQQQQGDEQHTTIVRPPLPINHHHLCTKQAPESTFSIKDLVNVIRPLTDYNCNKPQLPPISGSLTKSRNVQKENKPEIAEEPISRRTSRASICTTARRILVAPVAPRRNSLIPLPTATSRNPLPPPPLRPMGSLLPPLLPRPLPAAAERNEATDAGENSSEMTTPWSSKVGSRNSKINNILRRSIQKKVYIKSPLPPPQPGRRSSAMMGLERVRVSFGSQGRITQRVLVSNSSRTNKEKQKEKERGWNNGSSRTFI